MTESDCLPNSSGRIERSGSGQLRTPRPTTRGESVSERYIAEIGAEEPLYFASAGVSLFGWLCRPVASAAAGVGLVICNPFGFESICSHRSVRAFAAAAATIGVPSLRFDYVGTGDSQDIDPKVDRIGVWIDDIIAAVDELRRRTRVEQVCLLGFRLGAMLAALAATKCDAATALITVAPIVSGRRYLRELRTIHLAGSGTSSASRSAVAGPQGEVDSGSDESLELAGFSLSAASIAALSRLDLTDLRAPPVSDMLVIDRRDLPTAQKWSELMSGLGARVHYRRLPGFVEMMMTAPYFTVLPAAMIAATRDWLLLRRDALSQKHSFHRARHMDRTSSCVSAVLPLEGNWPSPRPSVTERAAFFGCEPLLFGIVTEPPATGERRGAVVLVNDGATHHVASNRMHVSLARLWARSGYVVLRMDLAGLGDSDTRPGRPPNEVFPPAAVDDIRTAVAFLRDRYGVADVTLAGLCSGAYHSLRAAVFGLPVSQIFLVNPQNFFWKQGTTLAELQLAEVIRNPSIYRERIFSAAGWARLLTGRVNVWRILSVYMGRAMLALEAAVRDAARRLGVRLPRDLGRELEELVARGIRIVFVFARGEPGIDLLRIGGGSSLQRLRDLCRVHIVDGADHAFSQSNARGRLEEILSAELLSGRERGGVMDRSAEDC